MRNQTFIVWSAAMAVGIALSPCLALSAYGLALAFLIVIAGLLILHRWRMPACFFALTCVFFVIAGLWRGAQGDWNILPSCVYNVAEHTSLLARERLRSLPLTQDTVSLLDAILFGQRHSLSYELRDLYNRAGAGHVLALSGLHLTILFSLLLRGLILASAIKWLRITLGLVGIVGIWGYVLVANMPVSLIRASVMMTLFFVSRMRLSGSDTWHTLGVAAMLILFVSPSSLWSASFQMSFGSLLGILLFYAPLRSLVRPDDTFLSWFCSAAVVGIAVQIAITPLIVYYFHRASVYSILFSPLYILIASVIIYTALPMLLFGGWTTSLVSATVSAQHYLMHFTTSLPGAVADNLSLSMRQLILWYMAIACFTPALYAVRWQRATTRALRLAYFFRRWPYVLASIICLMVAWVVG